MPTAFLPGAVAACPGCVAKNPPHGVAQRAVAAPSPMMTRLVPLTGLLGPLVVADRPLGACIASLHRCRFGATLADEPPWLGCLARVSHSTIPQDEGRASCVVRSLLLLCPARCCWRPPLRRSPIRRRRRTVATALARAASAPATPPIARPSAPVRSGRHAAGPESHPPVALGVQGAAVRCRTLGTGAQGLALGGRRPDPCQCLPRWIPWCSARAVRLGAA